MQITDDNELEAVKRLSRDIAKSAKLLSHQEARYLVDAYYAIQANRIAAGNQVRALSEGPEPCEVLVWLARQSETLEGQVRRALDHYTDAHEVGEWSKTIIGIGPVLAAGLLAHIDIPKLKTAGQIWRFAGLDPTVVWNKGERRPWNASLKTLCWKIGESFVKVSGHKESLYGKIYRERRAYEQRRSDAGELAEQAAAKLERFKIGKTTDAYKAYSIGKLPDGHLHARAKRAAVKLFLAHWFECAYETHNKAPAPKPYVIAHLDHTHHITWRDAA